VRNCTLALGWDIMPWLGDAPGGVLYDQGTFSIPGTAAAPANPSFLTAVTNVTKW
jgi:hypothetical protein